MGQLSDSVTQRVGPLPVWAWSALAAVGLVGFGAVRDRLRPEPEPVEPEPVEPVTGGASGPFTLAPSPLGSGTWAVAPATGGAAIGSPDTNNQWRDRAERWATNEGGLSPVFAANVITKYLDGLQLSTEEGAALNSILRAVGPAPEGAPLVLVAPAPPPSTPGPTPAPSPVPAGWVVVYSDAGGSVIVPVHRQADAVVAVDAWKGARGPKPRWSLLVWLTARNIPAQDIEGL